MRGGLLPCLFVGVNQILVQDEQRHDRGTRVHHQGDHESRQSTVLLSLHTIPQLHKVPNKAVTRTTGVVLLTVFVNITATVIVHDNVHEKY